MGEVSRENIKQMLFDIWADILNTKHIKDDSDFFELGGDSMGAVSILAKVYEIFDIKISLEEFLMNRSFDAQVNVIYKKVS